MLSKHRESEGGRGEEGRGRVAQREPVSQLRVDLVFAHTVALRQQQQLSLLAVACGRHRRPGLPTLAVTERERMQERTVGLQSNPAEFN